MPEHVRVAQTDDEVWMIFMNSEPNNQLTTEFIGQLNGALDNVEQQWKDSGSKGGAVVITSQIPKSFSAGIAEADAKDAKFLQSEYPSGSPCHGPRTWKVFAFRADDQPSLSRSKHAS